MRPVPGLGVTSAAVKGTSARMHALENFMKLMHVLSARHCARQSSMVVNGVFFRTRMPMVLVPSTPQSSTADEDGEGVDKVVVEVAVVEVIETAEDSLDEIEIEVDDDESLDNEELEEVLVVVSLVDVDSRVELEDVAVLEMEVEELKVMPAIVSLIDVESRVEVENEALLELDLELDDLEELAEDTTASHFPNAA